MFTLSVKFTVKPGCEAEAERIFREAVTEIRENEPGTLVMAFHRHKRAERTYVVYEIYRDKEAFKAHLDRMPASPVNAKLDALVDTREEIERLEFLVGIGLPAAEAEESSPASGG
jgi:quinol monooxygenase YgiN